MKIQDMELSYEVQIDGVQNTGEIIGDGVVLQPAWFNGLLSFYNRQFF